MVKKDQKMVKKDQKMVKKDQKLQTDPLFIRI